VPQDRISGIESKATNARLNFDSALFFYLWSYYYYEHNET